MKNIQLLFVVIVLSLSGCDWIWDKPEPEEEKLTEATQDGENTISCLVNGEVWLPKQKWLKSPISCQHYLYTEALSRSLWGQLNIVCDRYDGSEGESKVVIFCVNVNDTGQYPLYVDTLGIFAKGFYYLNTEEKDYVTHKSPNNWLKLTLRDTINRIVSGRFQFDAINEEDDTDTVKVRDGRFDLRF